MTALQILPSIISILSTVVIVIVAWSLRANMAELRKEIKQNSVDIDKVDSRASQKIERLENNFNELKADLPFVYVLREDFVRSMNNVDKHMSDISSKLDKLMEKR